MKKFNQKSIIQLIPDIVALGFDILTKRKQGAYRDIDGSLDHYDKYGYHTLRQAPPGSRKFDIIIPGPNAGKKYKIKN
jgi:hypothetical protein